MDFAAFLKGLFIGFILAAPVGPIGVLVISTSLGRGMLAGLACGTGAATADTLFAALAAFSTGGLFLFLCQAAAWLKLLGAALLVFLGVKTFRSKIDESASSDAHDKPELTDNLLSDCLTTCGLTLTNPATIITFMAIYATIGIQADTQFHTQISSAFSLVIGVFAGSLAWWIILSFVSSSLRSRITARGFSIVNKLSGGILILFAIAALFFSR
ncbi:MAG: LysE family translocator [Candidatus Obscuribacterales bacterium]|nr:LysE family translocator [Candidatus Obscuribacterales bacterium]